jgi:putative Mg2+ transporter-C (MgtC) family protein
MPITLNFASLQMSPEFLQSILLALFLGSLVGIERQWHRRLVDLKTNALVAMGACLFLLLSRTPQGFVDPIRMAAQIVVGVGFIGGGILFRDGGQTKGLNTAATLWCSAAVGALCGLDRWVDASVAAITIVLANTVLRQLAQYLNLQMGINDHLTDIVQFQWVCLASDAVAVQRKANALLADGQWKLRELGQEALDEKHVRLTVVAFAEHGEYDTAAQSIQQAMSTLPVVNFSWRKL